MVVPSFILKKTGSDNYSKELLVHLQAIRTSAKFFDCQIADTYGSRIEIMRKKKSRPWANSLFLAYFNDGIVCVTLAVRHWPLLIKNFILERNYPMKKLKNPEKNSETVSNIIQKTYDAGKKATANIQKSAKILSDKTKNDSYLRKVKKYNPIFPELLSSPDFNIPNIIMIVDDAVRRDVDVCEGSIGWLGKENDIEILYLYDTAIEMSGIQFIPMVTCETVYCVDSFDSNRFIKADYVFTRAHEERLAELKSIAFLLGAKSCSIEISETNIETNSKNKEKQLSEDIGLTDKGVSASKKFEQNTSKKESNHRTGKLEMQFEGSNRPKRPVLKWFAHDGNINRLIEMRFENGNAIKSEILELAGSSLTTMSEKAAYAMDMAIKKTGVKGKVKKSTDISSQVAKESHTKLIFRIEF